MTDYIFEVSAINSSRKEVFPEPEFHPEFYELALHLIQTNPHLILNFLHQLNIDFEKFGFTEDVFNVFMLPADRDLNEDNEPIDEPGDLIYMIDTNHLVNGVKLRVYFTVAPEFLNISKQQILSIVDNVPDKKVKH